MVKQPKIVILGIGCTLLSDQGFGISVVQALAADYDFPPSVEVVDGGLIGIALTGVIADADHLVVVDAIRNQGEAGSLYRLEGEQVLQRLGAENSVPQVEFLEALAHCQSLDNPPETVLLGIEPEDTDSVACALTPVLHDNLSVMVSLVLDELKRLSVDYRSKREPQACA